MPCAAWLYAATRCSSSFTYGPRMKCWLAHTFSMTGSDLRLQRLVLTFQIEQRHCHPRLPIRCLAFIASLQLGY